MITNSKLMNHKTNWPRFFGRPCIFWNTVIQGWSCSKAKANILRHKKAATQTYGPALCQLLDYVPATEQCRQKTA